jgi:hypothetical protein
VNGYEKGGLKPVKPHQTGSGSNPQITILALQ